MRDSEELCLRVCVCEGEHAYVCSVGSASAVLHPGTVVPIVQLSWLILTQEPQRAVDSDLTLAMT